MKQSALPSSAASSRLEQILDPAHCLCKEDVVWILEFIKKKVAEEDPCLLDLSQPRLLRNFHFFAEVAMQLVHPRQACAQEAERLREWIREAVYGLDRSPDKR